jgi:hypothetical protein
MIIPALLLCIGVALFRRSSGAVVEGPQADAPLRLLRWAAGLLSAQRDEWGRAMLGELDHIEGRSRRWRFTIGCVGAALLLPWGRAGAGVLAMLAVAFGSVGLYASVRIRYGLGSGNWIVVAIVVVILLSFVLAAIALLRRPGVAVPGLLGGLFVALAWLAVSGFAFIDFLTRVYSAWATPLLWIVVPAVVGVVGTLWGGSAAAGRRTARLAGISAGLGVYLYGTLAVAVVGAGGPPDDSGFTSGYIIGDRLGTNVIFYLVLLPLVTATVGWAAAAATAATAGIRPRLATHADSVPFTAAGRAKPMTMADAVGSAVPAASRRTVRLVLQCAGVAAAVLVAATSWLSG